MSLETISKKFTNKTLDTIIRNHGGIKHTSWRFGDGFRKDESFISEVCRLIVTGIKEDQNEFELRMIIKSMPKNLSRRLSVRSVDFFRNEINFYEFVLKKLDSFGKARNVADGFVEIPSCYASLSDGENDFIALEDLTFDGYETTNRVNEFDFNQCKQIMTILGKFHAISLAMRDQEPDNFDEMINYVEETYYNDKLKTWYEPYQKDFIFATRDAIAREFGGTVYESKMKEFTDPNTFYDTMCKLVRMTNQFSVICHGDLWIPNFLFKTNVKVIDFQMMRFASPATDTESLIHTRESVLEENNTKMEKTYFVFVCVNSVYEQQGQGIREQHFDELIQVYHQSATATLQSLGSNASLFLYSDLQQELKDHAKFGVGMAMGALSLCVTNDDETSKVREIDGDAIVPLDNILFIEPCKTKEGRLRMASTYKHAVDAGFFN